MCIVLCSNGYPETYKKNVEIPNLHKVSKNKKNFVFHAGTKKNNGDILSTGGRVLNIVSKGQSFYQISLCVEL